MRPTERVVPIRDVQLFTREVGRGAPVIILHGGPGAHHDYLLPYFDGLATGRRLLYYDQRGGGRSPVDRAHPVGWREHVADLESLLDHWNVGPATILGYSWGGLLALLFATERPYRVSRLALVSPAPATARARTVFERRFVERMQRPAIVSAREALRDSDLRQRDRAAYQQRAFELSVAGYFAELSSARRLTPFRVNGRTQTAVWESLGDYDLRDRVGSLSIPTLVVHGRHDPIPLESSEELARLLNASLEVFEHSGHVPYVEEYGRFLGALGGFLPCNDGTIAPV